MEESFEGCYCYFLFVIPGRGTVSFSLAISYACFRKAVARSPQHIAYPCNHAQNDLVSVCDPIVVKRDC